MNIRRAQEALEELGKIANARIQWRNDIDKVVDYSRGFMGPQGVSSNTAFMNAAMKMFDEHVAHLVERYRTKIISALDET